MTDQPDTPLSAKIMTDQPDTPLSEQMAEEASTPAVKPAGSPNMWPYIGLPRRVKADFFRFLKNLPVDDNGKFIYERGDMAMAAAAINATADIEDALRVAAADRGKFEAWAKTCTDKDLMGLFAWYMASFQPGEATPSPA